MLTQLISSFLCGFVFPLVELKVCMSAAGEPVRLVDVGLWTMIIKVDGRALCAGTE